MLRTIIIEDEPLSMQYICSLLETCKEVEIVALATTAEEAIHVLNTIETDLVFLDVELHTGTGFEVLIHSWKQNYAVVFTSAINQEALNIIKNSGVPLLQKPLAYEEIQKLITEINNTDRDKYLIAVNHLVNTLKNNNAPLHIAVDKEADVEYILLGDIIKLTTHGQKTIFHLPENKEIISTQALRYFEKLLEDFYFFRLNAEEIISMENVKTLSENFQQVVMSDNSTVQISPKKKEEFVEAYKNYQYKNRFR